MAFRTALVAIILIAQHFALPPSTSAQSKAPYAHGSDQVTQKTSGGVLFNPLQQKPVSYEDSSFRMALIGPPGKFALQVEEKATSGGKHFVQLPEEVAQVNEIRRVQGAKAAVVAMVNGDVWECIIVDLNNARLADKFLCYEPNVSPDGQFISFVKFFPPHGGDDPEDHYMLYDLSKDAAGNRPSGVAANDSKAVGVTVYPVGTGNRPFDNIHHAEPAAHRLSSAGFFWNAAGNKVVFADAYEGQISVIAVSISSRRIATTTIFSPRDLCADTSAQGCTFRLVRVDFGSPPKDELTLAFEGTLWNVGQKALRRLRGSEFSVVGVSSIWAD